MQGHVAAREDAWRRRVRVVPPEDPVVVKAIVAAEHAPRHWHDALAIIASTELDRSSLI